MVTRTRKKSMIDKDIVCEQMNGVKQKKSIDDEKKKKKDCRGSWLSVLV